MKKYVVLLCFLTFTLFGRAVDFEYDGVTYTILSETDKTVSTKEGVIFSAPPEHAVRTGELHLHEQVPYNGNTYTLTQIGAYSFYECRELTGSLIIPNSVTAIGKSAFEWCIGFTGPLTIPNSVTTIGWEAFSECSGFNGKLSIGNSVTEIGHNAFSNCSNLSSIELGASVKTVGNSAFNGCPIKDINSLNPTPPSFYYNTFSDYTATVTVEAEALEAYLASDWSKFENLYGVKQLTLDGVNYRIESYGIAKVVGGNYESLKKVYIHDYVVYKDENYH